MAFSHDKWDQILEFWKHLNDQMQKDMDLTSTHKEMTARKPNPSGLKKTFDSSDVENFC